ncbi:acyl carrier protein [Nocardiopsis sp. CNT-189]|uniref:acyl carrier protein n=1 Tax=Nocardiopsis oceanisediminis TaxID=2816862 RepID=UPI003B35168F
MPADAVPLKARLAAMPDAERERLLLDVVVECTAAVLGHPDVRDLEPDMEFAEAGVDSIAAVEIRSRISARLGAPVPRTVLEAAPTFAEAARALLPLSRGPRG